jgi:hypothetical protein
VSGVTGQLGTLAIGKQTVKGTPAVSATYKLKFTGGNLEPKRGLIQLQESDSSRMRGDTIAVSEHVEGATSHYARPSDFGLLAYLALGANADSGAGPYVHVATPANSGLWVTAWKNIGGSTLIDKYSDLRVTGLHLKGGAGQALTVDVDWMGLTAAFGATDDASAVVTETPFVYPQVTVTKGGSAPGTIESFSIDITNGAEMFTGDKQLNPYDLVWGELGVTGTLTMLFESDAAYRTFHTASSSGTTFSGTQYAESLVILASQSASASIQVDIANIVYTDLPVAPNPGGQAIRVVMPFNAKPSATIGNVIKLTTTNSVATY